MTNEQSINELNLGDWWHNVEGGASAGVQRHCIICHDILVNEDLRVCRCGYVHLECVLMIARSIEDEDPLRSDIVCSRCQDVIKLHPKRGMLLHALLLVSAGYQIFCDIIFNCLVLVFAEHVIVTHGLFFLSQFAENRDVTKMISSLGPGKTIVSCHVLLVSAIVVNRLCWEDSLLRYLRRCSHLPVVGRFFPKEYPEVQESPDKEYTFLDTVIGGLLLPYYAQVCGDLFLYNVDSRLQRYLLGAALFLAGRGILNMYYKQSLYKRANGLRVLGFEES